MDRMLLLIPAAITAVIVHQLNLWGMAGFLAGTIFWNLIFYSVTGRWFQ